MYKHRVSIPLKSYFELKRIHHYLLQDQKWQSVGAKMLIVYIQKKIVLFQSTVKNEKRDSDTGVLQ